MSCNHKSTLASMLCWRCQGKETMEETWPLDGEEIMTSDTHCFDCKEKLDDCICFVELDIGEWPAEDDEPVERGIAWG